MVQPTKVFTPSFIQKLILTSIVIGVTAISAIYITNLYKIEIKSAHKINSESVSKTTNEHEINATMNVINKNDKKNYTNEANNLLINNKKEFANLINGIKQTLQKIDSMVEKEQLNRDNSINSKSLINLDIDTQIKRYYQMSFIIYERLMLISRMEKEAEKIIKNYLENAPISVHAEKILNEVIEKFLESNLSEVRKKLNYNYLNSRMKSTEDFVNYSKEILAEEFIIKSVSDYLQYKPQEANYNFQQAEKIYPNLDTIKALKPSYKDLPNIRYAYVTVATVNEAKNRGKSEIEILGHGNAKELFQLGFQLFMKYNTKTIKVYTIIEYSSEKELENKYAKIHKLIPHSAIDEKDILDFPVEFKSW